MYPYPTVQLGVNKLLYCTASLLVTVHFKFMLQENLCKKVPGKKVSEKKPGNKNFGKKSEFSQVLGKNVTGNKVLCL